MSTKEIAELCDNLVKLKNAAPGYSVLLSRRALDELGGMAGAHEKLAPLLTFNHAWMYDPITDNIVIGRLLDSWRETMRLVLDKAEADRNAAFRNTPDQAVDLNELSLTDMIVKLEMLKIASRPVRVEDPKPKKEAKPKIDYLKITASLS